ncbi:AraC-type DNA-binding protein [Arthrobacter sp. yr096]|uniref:helix-turn-helix domain-containing protein n=1 Tax=Arthrobacter sp. yr096 TaxID=1761750 RepID=UPI0008C352AA|nr:AraC family transcriptional regulator [Arthrobacter sp. yr096]SEJ47205.1 AraC-type DNA-binding protein [Arthrobacter sp. yr096]
MTRQAISQSGQAAPQLDVQVEQQLDAPVEGRTSSQVYGVYTGYFECPTPATWTDHVHDTHELLWGARGVLTVEADGGLFAVPATLGLWIPAGVVHAVKSTQGTGFYCSHINARVAPQLESRTVAVTVPTAAQELLRHMSKFDMDDSIRKRSEQVVVGLLEVVDARPMLLPMPVDPRLELIARALLDDPALDRSLEEWSVEVAISVRNLSRLFHKETGMTFAQWRIHARVRVALGLLAAGYPVSTVSRRVGYNNPSAFVQVFRKVMGHTPGWYVSSLKAGNHQSLAGSE